MTTTTDKMTIPAWLKEGGRVQVSLYSYRLGDSRGVNIKQVNSVKAYKKHIEVNGEKFFPVKADGSIWQRKKEQWDIYAVYLEAYDYNKGIALTNEDIAKAHADFEKLKKEHLAKVQELERKLKELEHEKKMLEEGL